MISNMYEIIQERDQYKAERNSLIDDLSWYKAKVSRLERENHDFKKRNALLMNTVDDLDKENKALRLQSDTYFEQWQQHKALNNEFSQHIGNKPSSSTYKYFREKLDGLGIEEGD
ncbi:hypothetical protein [Staphylococcus sp. ZWU0021]|uniref:hypothetical protein n=1 Tax=Staphylococcus sp. ZWU0021 TaxID=1339238 RepID=UPI0006459D7A|nr:hypothetical protein [Staphylococcus sp. ZWU0021]